MKKLVKKFGSKKNSIQLLACACPCDCTCCPCSYCAATWQSQSSWDAKTIWVTTYNNNSKRVFTSSRIL